jgi:hypothetical protein
MELEVSRQVDGARVTSNANAMAFCSLGCESQEFFRRMRIGGDLPLG